MADEEERYEANLSAELWGRKLPGSFKPEARDVCTLKVTDSSLSVTPGLFCSDEFLMELTHIAESLCGHCR